MTALALVCVVLWIAQSIAYVVERLTGRDRDPLPKYPSDVLARVCGLALLALAVWILA